MATPSASDVRAPKDSAAETPRGDGAIEGTEFVRRSGSENVKDLHGPGRARDVLAERSGAPHIGGACGPHRCNDLYGDEGDSAAIARPVCDGRFCNWRANGEEMDIATFGDGGPRSVSDALPEWPRSLVAEGAATGEATKEGDLGVPSEGTCEASRSLVDNSSLGSCGEAVRIARPRMAQLTPAAKKPSCVGDASSNSPKTMPAAAVVIKMRRDWYAGTA